MPAPLIMFKRRGGLSVDDHRGEGFSDVGMTEVRLTRADVGETRVSRLVGDARRMARPGHRRRTEVRGSGWGQTSAYRRHLDDDCAPKPKLDRAYSIKGSTVLGN